MINIKFNAAILHYKALSLIFIINNILNSYTESWKLPKHVDLYHKTIMIIIRLDQVSFRVAENFM